MHCGDFIEVELHRARCTYEMVKGRKCVQGLAVARVKLTGGELTRFDCIN